MDVICIPPEKLLIHVPQVENHCSKRIDAHKLRDAQLIFSLLGDMCCRFLLLGHEVPSTKLNASYSKIGAWLPLNPSEIMCQ